MSEKKLAPHVARAVGAVQAKEAPGQTRPPAPHLARALAAPTARIQPQHQASAPPVAPHVAAALSRAAAPTVPARPLQKQAAPVSATAPHVASGIRLPPAVPRSAGGKGGASPHSLQAKALPAPPPAAHLEAALRRGAAGAPAKAVQMSKKPRNKTTTGTARKKTRKELTQERKERNQLYIDTEVNDINQRLRQPLFESFTKGAVQDFKVGIKGIQQENLVLGDLTSKMSNFSTSIMGIYEAKPEVQTGIVSNRKTGQVKLKISSNVNSKNKLIRKDVGDKTLSQFYRSTVRPYHVIKRRNSVRSSIRKLSESQIRDVLEETAKVSKDEGEFLEKTRQNLALKGHQDSKEKSEVRRRVKSARRFSLKSDYKDTRLDIPDNKDEFHAESLILQDCLAKNEDLQQIIGTKVPCLACKAYFSSKNAPGLLLRHTSFGWVSASSLKQLGRALKETISQEDVRWYLGHLQQHLKVVDLRAYNVSSGKISIKDMTLGGDSSSDSEDVDARDGYKIDSFGDEQPEKKSLRKRKRGSSGTGGNSSKKKKREITRMEKDQKIFEQITSFSQTKYKKKK
jgi:hypothetical protein